MVQYKTEGIVIGGSRFGEADRILRVLTKDRGKVSAMAKGVRRGKSKFSGCLEPMMVNTFLIAEGRNMDTVCQAENIRSYSNVRSDYSLVCRAGNLLEAAGKLTEEGLPEPVTYDLLIGALDALDAGAPPQFVELLFKTKLLQEHGVFPDLSGCNGCGETRTKAIHFDGTQMAFLCDTCAKAKGIFHPVPNKALDGLYKASQVDTKKRASFLEMLVEVNPTEESNETLPSEIAVKAVQLADEMLSAFLQTGVGGFKSRNKQRFKGNS